MTKRNALPVLRLNPAGVISSQGEEIYDICVGLSQKTLNATMKSIFDGMYPKHLMDSIDLKDLKVKILWNIVKPPEIKLEKKEDGREELFSSIFKDSDLDNLKKHLNSSLSGVAALSDLPEILTASDFLDEASVLSVSVNLPCFELVLQASDGSSTPPVAFAVDFSTLISIDNTNEISLQPFAAHVRKPEVIKAVLSESQIDGINQEAFFFFLMNDILIPVMLSKVGGLLPKFKVPDFEYMSAALTGYRINVVNSFLVASACFRGKSQLCTDMPTINQAVGDSGEGFFVSLSTVFLQKTLDIAIKLFNPISGQGGKILTATYKYCVNLSAPSIKISNNIIKLGISADAEANVFLKWLYFAYALMAQGKTEGNPILTGQLDFNEKNQIVLKVIKVEDLNIRLAFAGSIPVNTFLLNGLADLMSNAILKIVNELLMQINVTLFDIPTFTFIFDDLAISAKMRNSQTVADGNNFKLTGDFDVSVNNKCKGRILYGVANQCLRPGEYITSPDGKHFLIYQEDGDLVLYETLVHKQLWNTDTSRSRKHKNPFCAIMQEDGNFVIYTNNNGKKVEALWASDTCQRRRVEFFLALENGGSLIIYESPQRPCKYLYDPKKSQNG